MRGIHLLASIICLPFCLLKGQNSHLLIYSQGDGGLYRTEKGSNEPLAKASFLPKDKRISVRPRSGLETLAAGFQFRFGAGTVFSLNRSEISLEQGGILINSKRLSNQISLLGPESTLGVSGVGCCLINVEPNGGFKAVGLLGKISLSDLSKGENFMLLPGQLVFLMPGGRGFGEEVSVNLAKLIDSSYLISGFPNSTTFMNSLTSMMDAQAKMVGKTYGAVVGSAKQSESFEVLPTKDASQSSAPVSQNSMPTVSANSNGFKNDPLSELLGRPPKRQSEEASGHSSRPFPSRVLRGSN
jgi:hypothetical protein